MDWKKGDLRRMLAVLGAISDLKYPTLSNIALALGWGRNAAHTVRNLMSQAEEQAGVVIQRDGFLYNVEDWGPILKADGALTVWRLVRDGIETVPANDADAGEAARALPPTREGAGERLRLPA